LALNMHILFDIGGTKSRIAVSLDARTIEATHKFDTPPHFADAMVRFKEEAAALLQGRVPRSASGGIRGVLSREHDALVSDTVLTDWVGKPLQAALTEALGVAVRLENDASLAALGEAHHGAGRGYEIVAYHTVSTGVGGARIVKGVIDVASSGFEPGKQVVDLDHTKLGGENDTLEELISGEALERRRGVKPYEIPQADPVWEELGRYLAYGLKNTVAYWSPDVIILGGSMIKGDPRIPLEPIRLHLGALLKGLMPCPPLFDAAFRDDGGLYGALVLAREFDERQVKKN